MYKELTVKELDRRLRLVDEKINCESPSIAKDVLKFVHTLFPLEYVMPADFRGTHALYLRKDGKLEVGVWCNNKHFPVWED